MRSLPYGVALVMPILWGCAGARTRCSINSDCSPGHYCESGACLLECRDNLDCASGLCEKPIGKCFPTGDGGGPLPGQAHDLAVTGFRPPDLAMPVMDSPDLLSPPLLTYGDVCTAGAMCDSNLCSKNPWAASDKECTGPCKVAGDCMVGDFCVAQGLNQCAQSDVGGSCNGAADCRGGACVSGGGAPSFCTIVCQSAANCPAGYSCSPIMGTWVCINLDVTPHCNGNADCWYGTFCDVANGRCLGACRSDADCPLWNYCQSVNGKAVCQPKLARGRGGVGDTCASGNDCRASFCLNTKCVGACGVTKDKGQYCPGGWGCNPVDTGGGAYTLACLPAGSGSPGDPCNDNGGCASALCIGMPGYCSRFCNGAPCPSVIPNCAAVGIKADGVTLLACSK